VSKTLNKIIELIKLNIFDYIISTQFTYNEFESKIYYNCFSEKSMMPYYINNNLNTFIKEHSNKIINKSLYSLSSHYIYKEFYNINTCCPDKVYICGFDTDACVLASTIEIFQAGIIPVVLADYCNSIGGIKYHNVRLICLERIISRKQIIYGEIKSRSDLII